MVEGSADAGDEGVGGRWRGAGDRRNGDYLLEFGDLNVEICDFLSAAGSNGPISPWGQS